MKKITIALIATVTILFSFTGCDKYHRDRYTGTWEFETVKIYYSGSYDTELIEVKRDTIYYTGKISLGHSEDELIIQYAENDEINARLDYETYIYNSTLECDGKYPFGKFENKNKLNFRLNWVEKIEPKFFWVHGTKMKGGKK
jgi:hypothetical protein